MTRRNARILWVLAALMALGGMSVAAHALRSSRPQPAVGNPVIQMTSGDGGKTADLDRKLKQLAARRLTRRIIPAPAKPAPPPPPPAPLESLIRLKGILDFEGVQPSLAVIEILSERKVKVFKSGDAISTTGAVLREIGQTVTVEYGRRTFRMTYKGASEVPPGAVGSN